MRATTIVDAEDDLLQGLPMLSQILYIRVLRRLMDDQTGLSGGRRGSLITMRKCQETLYVEPHRGLTGSGLPTRWAVARLLRWLEKAGLIERRKCPEWPDSMLFYLPVAHQAIQEWREYRKAKIIREAQAARAAAEQPAPNPHQTRTAEQAAKPAPNNTFAPIAEPKPAPNPPETRTEPAPAKPRPTPSPENNFLQRFQKGTNKRRSQQPDADSSAQNKPAPNPLETRTEPKPNPEVAKALLDGICVDRAAGGRIAFNLAKLLKAAPSSVNLGDSFNVEPEPKKPRQKNPSEMTSEERTEVLVAGGVPRDVAEALAVQRARLAEGIREWRAKDRWPPLQGRR